MSQSTIVAFYGPVELSGTAIEAIAQAIDNHTDLEVTPANLGNINDPAFNVIKYAMVFYALAPGLPYRMRVAQDSQKLNFSLDIKSIVWGNVPIKDQSVYNGMYTALINNKGYPVTLSSMGGVDPAPNTLKTATVVYFKGPGPAKEVSAQDNGTIQWN